MRSGWNRATALLDLNTEVVEALVGKAIPDAKVVRFQAVEGGLANTNIKVELEEASGSTVLLKIFVRDPEAAPKEYALNNLVCGRVCTPKFLYFSDENLEIEYPYAVIEWVEGTMLQSVFPNLSEERRRNLGESIGYSLAEIHSFKFPVFGFFDGNLKIKEPITMDGAGLLSYVRKCLVEGFGGKRIGAELTERLINFLEQECKLLDLWNGEPCLTHADFNHSNILVAPKTPGSGADPLGAWPTKDGLKTSKIATNDSEFEVVPEFEVAAVLDWEFAFSGTPFFDFGNLLRAPIGSSKAFVDGVEYGYKQAGGVLPSEWRKMSLLTDLTAWTEFMTRDNVNETSSPTRQK
jgi:Predicted aminoglycoside phosphotransferase